MKGIVPRLALTAGALLAYGWANTAHEIISPLVSGPMAAQQLSDSNGAYISSQVASRMFNGSGFSGGIALLVLGATLLLIWSCPIKRLFANKDSN